MKKLLTLMLAALLGLTLGGNAAAEEKKLNSEDFESLYTLAEQYGFKMGACFSYSDLSRNKPFLQIASRHFNSITCTNETKAYSLLNQNASRMAQDGMPRMNYAQADAMIKWAQENQVKVRGHVLVWDAYMSDWFFHERYDSSKPYADRETVRVRMKSYIEQVITHFEEKFPGVIYCWDVVNEAIGDNANEYSASDPRHLRTMRNGAPNPFLLYAGEDYVEYAFLCARDTVEQLGTDIRLFYNDYNLFQSGKRAAAKELAESINRYAQDEQGQNRKLIDGIGMQGYIGGYGTQNGCMNNNDIIQVRDSIREYASLGLEVHITEMAVRNYDLSEQDRHTEFYANLFKMFRKVNEDTNGALTAVCIWGISDCPQLPKDNYSWKLNSPYGGLLTEKNELKPEFEAVYRVLRGE